MSDTIHNVTYRTLGRLMAGDIEAPRTRLLTRTDGKALFYPATTNVVFGQSGDGKSFVALVAAVESLARGEGVVYYDHESSPASIAARLQALGASPEVVDAGFRYATPSGPFGPADFAHFDAIEEEMTAAGWPPKLIVIDAVVEAMAIAGLNEDKAGDYARWFEKVPRRFARSGYTILLVDHVVKISEGNADLFPRGSGHKRASVDGAAYRLEPVESFSRLNSGRALLRIAKDREGCVGPAGAVAAVVHFDVSDGGDRMNITLEPPSDLDASNPTPEPADTMAAISRVFEGLPDGTSLSIHELRPYLPGVRVQVLTESLNTLRSRGYVSSVLGPRGGDRFTLLHPFEGRWDTCTECGGSGANVKPVDFNGVLCADCAMRHYARSTVGVDWRDVEF
jgi:hypothetical protein